MPGTQQSHKWMIELTDLSIVAVVQGFVKKLFIVEAAICIGSYCG
jgi:hypothetical protein